MVIDHQSHLNDRPYPDPEIDEIVLADVRDETAVTEVAAHVDGIIHLAAVLGTQETIQNPRPSAITNIIGSLNVFEAANQYDIPVVYAGVGNHWMRDLGAGSYTISKTAAEDFARMFNAFRGGNISIIRPVNAYGPGQSVASPYGPSKVRKIMPSFICRALTGNPIEIYGDGTQISDCVYVEDVARTFVGALEFGATRKQPLKVPAQVGPLESHTVKDIAQKVAYEVAAETGKQPVDIEYLPMRPGEVPNAVVQADPETMVPLGGEFDPSKFMSLDDGIASTVQYFVNAWLPEYQG